MIEGGDLLDHEGLLRLCQLGVDGQGQGLLGGPFGMKKGARFVAQIGEWAIADVAPSV